MDETYIKVKGDNWSYLYRAVDSHAGRRAKKPIHDGSQKNELNGYG
jgi:hypothetical protein